MSAPERRHFSRVAFAAEAYLSTVAERFTARVLDLSLRGALLELPQAPNFEAGEPCLLAIQLGEHPLKMAGDVAHVKVRQEGPLVLTQIGFQCRSIDLESVTHLRRLVEVNLGNPELLERQLQALLQG